MAAPSSPAHPAPVKLGAADPVERWGQHTLEGNLAFERGEEIKARQSYSEALAVAEEMMVAAARAHDTRAARFAPALYGISCNDIIALARKQDDGLSVGIFLCKLAGGYLSVMESAEAPLALRKRCLLHSRLASATLCAYFEERGMWDAAETYSARANAAFFSLQALDPQPAPALPAELPSLLLQELPEMSLLLPDLPEMSLLLPELLEPKRVPPEPKRVLPELPDLPEPRRVLEPSPLLHEPPEPSSLPPEPSAPPPRIPRPARPVAGAMRIDPPAAGLEMAASSIEPAASSVAPPVDSVEPAAPSFELPIAASIAPPLPSATPPLPTWDTPAPRSAPRGLAAFGDAHIVPPSEPWAEPQPELRPSLWSDANPALDLSPPQPPPRRTRGARLLDWAARVFRRSPRSTLPSLGSRSA